MDFYFNSLDLINQFLFYFKDKATKLLQTDEKKRFIIPRQMRGQLIKEPTHNDFIESIKTKKLD